MKRFFCIYRRGSTSNIRSPLESIICLFYTRHSLPQFMMSLFRAFSLPSLLPPVPWPSPNVKIDLRRSLSKDLFYSKLGSGLHSLPIRYMERLPSYTIVSPSVFPNVFGTHDPNKLLSSLRLNRHHLFRFSSSLFQFLHSHHPLI